MNASFDPVDTGMVYYVGRHDEVEHHARPLRAYRNIEICEPEALPNKVRAGDVCVFYNEFFSRFRDCCLTVQKLGCSTIYAIDGIVEWRNLWEFPSESGACLWAMRPVLSNKVACIGRSQARILESWGNVGKCEVVGVPRFDNLRDQKPRNRVLEPFTLLIMTAKNPGFTVEQTDIARQSLSDLKVWIDTYNSINARQICPRWRLTGGLDATIQVPNELRDTTGVDLYAALQAVDAVVTTPSTAILESMLLGLPVAILDYTNSPHYVPTAWSITAKEHFDRVIPALMDPPAERLLLQSTLLHDHLECRTPATSRMATLIDEMLKIGQRCQLTRTINTFPGRILVQDENADHLPEEVFNLQRLFPTHSTFSNSDMTLLQVEVAHLRVELKNKADQLAPWEAILSRLHQNLLTRVGLKLFGPLVKRFL